MQKGANDAIVSQVLPAPAYRRADDYIFVSSIYPLDNTGNVVHAQAISPYVGESEIAVQTRSVLETLKSILAQAGTSLENTIKAEVYLENPADFYEFKLAWKEYFPTEPPARTTAVVGDDHIIPGCRLNLQAIALAGDSRYKRETIRAEEVPDPMEAEHVPQAIKAGPFIFPSGLPATDFKTGLAVGKKPMYPYYGSEAEMQAHYVFQNLDKVLKAAGSGLNQAIKAQLYEVDLNTFHDVDGVWVSYMPIPPTRSSMAVRGLLVPGAVFIANLMFLAPDAKHQKKETKKGISFHPIDIRKVNFTPGIISGNWLFTSGQAAFLDYEKGLFAQAPLKLPYYFSDIEIETEFVMKLLRDQLEANDYYLTDIVDARVYLVYPQRDYRGFERVWRRIFEPLGYFPSMSLIPSRQANGGGGVMAPDLNVEIDLISIKKT